MRPTGLGKRGSRGRGSIGLSGCAGYGDSLFGALIGALGVAAEGVVWVAVLPPRSGYRHYGRGTATTVGVFLRSESLLGRARRFAGASGLGLGLGSGSRVFHVKLWVLHACDAKRGRGQDVLGPVERGRSRRFT